MHCRKYMCHHSPLKQLKWVFKEYDIDRRTEHPQVQRQSKSFPLATASFFHVLYNTAFNPGEPGFRHSYLLIVLDTVDVFLKSVGDKTGMPVLKYWSLHGTSLKKYNYLFKAFLCAEVQSGNVKFFQKSFQKKKKISSKNWNVLNFCRIWFQSKRNRSSWCSFRSFPYLGRINSRNWPGRIPHRSSINVCYNHNSNDNK